MKYSLLGLSLLLAGVMYLTSPMMAAGFKHFGFPGYFRVESGVGKIIGGIVLMLPAIPRRIKEWAYVATAIVYLSALIAHTSVDGIATTISPLISFGLWVVSFIVFDKINRGNVEARPVANNLNIE